MPRRELRLVEVASSQARTVAPRLIVVRERRAGLVLLHVGRDGFVRRFPLAPASDAPEGVSP